ncbi:MAG: tripartite tricarboxylate transporter substrate binding protein [Burkholderiaceae bacterium]|nr:tripartite tricarboxylate transporter substrate binding protein [Burkholderiaceae bacterium]
MKTIAALFAGCVITSVAGVVAAAEFPTKAMSIVVPFGAGGSTDLMTRALAIEMGKSLGQEVVVVNKAGAGGTIGTAEVAAAKNDGYTIGMLPVGPLTTQPNLRRLPYGADSFEYVCLVYSNPQALLVRKDAPFRNVLDLVAYAKKNPGMKYGSSGAGSVPHMAVVAFAQATGIDVVHVPHKGDSDNLTSVLGGHITTFVTHTAFVASNADSVRALGLMAPKRLKEVPDLPTFAEQGAPALNFQVWGGLAVPKGTAAPVVARLEKACQAAVASDAFRGQLAKLNTPEAYMGSKEFGAFVLAEFDRNRDLLLKAGMKKE